MQETWLRVLERGGSYDGHSRFELWIFSVAHNLALDAMRKRPIFSLDSNEEYRVCSSPTDESLASAISAEKEQSLREHLSRFSTCNEYLNSRDRVIAGLSGFSFEEKPALNAKVSGSPQTTGAAGLIDTAAPKKAATSKKKVAA